MFRWIVALLAVSAFVLLATIASGPNELSIDKRIRGFLLVDPGPVKTFATAIGWTMRTMPVVVICIGIATYLGVGRKLPGAWLLIVILPLMHLSYPLKELIASPRPDGTDGDWGFPAGRVGNAVWVADSLSIVAGVKGWTRWVIPAAWVVLVSWARVATGNQWPTDVLGAVLWSSAAVILVLASGERIVNRRNVHSSGNRR